MGYVGSNPTLGTTINVYTYILFSKTSNKYYIGSTADYKKRLLAHNKGSSTYTKKFRPWKLVYLEKFKTRSKAIIREKEIKSYKGGNKFNELFTIASR